MQLPMVVAICAAPCRGPLVDVVWDGLCLQAHSHAIDGGPFDQAMKTQGEQARDGSELGQPHEEVQGLRLILGIGAAIDDRRSIVAIDNRHSVIDR